MNANEEAKLMRREIRNEINTPVLRDRLAMAVLAGFVTCDASGTTFWSTGPQMEDAAKTAYAWADVMLKARK
jgi:hypothetical protein